MMRFGALLNKELREQRRTYRLLILAVVMVFIGLSSPLTAAYLPVLMSSLPGLPPGIAELMPDPTIQEAFTQYLKNMSQLSLIVVIVLTMGIVAQEIERGTAAMLLTKPVRRSEMILTKWLAGLVTLLVGLFLAGISFTLYTLVLFEPFSLVDFIVSNALIAVFLVFYQTLALMASSLVRTQAMAAVIAFLAMLLALVVDSIPVIGDFMPSELLNWAMQRMIGSPTPEWGALCVSLALIGVFLLAAIFRLQREEI
jgi:ABC-2 type transport system permease protein